MIEPPHSTPDRSAQSARRARDPFLALANAIERNPYWVDSAGEWDLPPEKNRRRRKVRVRPPDGLRPPADAACRLGCSIKTLDGYVKAGALKYVALGHGKRRQRRMYADADLDEFIANQTRKDSPCPSTRTRTVDHRSTITTSGSKVVGFMEARSKRRNAKPKR